MDQYLSRLIRHNVLMLAVVSSTSTASWMSHQSGPKIQKPINSRANENGITTKPNNISLTANDAINQFCVGFKLFSVNIAIQTRRFPTTMRNIIVVIKQANRVIDDCV